MKLNMSGVAITDPTALRKLASIERTTAALIADRADYAQGVWRDLIRGCADDVIYWRAYGRLVTCGVPAARAATQAASYIVQAVHGMQP